MHFHIHFHFILRTPPLSSSLVLVIYERAACLIPIQVLFDGVTPPVYRPTGFSINLPFLD
jgi:hypothetical protein